jgi:cell division initiation protein
MDSSQAPTSILETLRTVEFRLGLKGYNVDEVDEYLDKAAQEAEGLQEHVRQLNERLRQSSERITQLERERRAAPAAAEAGEEGVAATPDAAVLSDETLQRTLLLAQKFVDQTKRESEAEAASLVAHAEETAAAAIAAAEATAAQLQAESQKELREEVARLEATRTELATDVESMARHLDSERNRLTAALSDILTWVEDNVQPANSLMGVKAKSSKATSGGDPDRLPETDDGAPTLNFQSVSGAAASGAPHSL